MSKVLLVIDMSDEDYQLLEKYTKQKMIVDIGFNHDNMFGWTFMRRKVLRAKPMPERINPFFENKGDKGWVSVLDGLPSKDGRYYVARHDFVTQTNFTDILWYEKGVWWNRQAIGDYAVIAWQLLPEPYKAESEK